MNREPEANTGSGERLPNGMVGKQFITTIPLGDEQDLLALESMPIEGLEPLGLEATIDHAGVTLRGTPQREGEHRFRVGRREFSWFVNADPRSLWQEHEPDPSFGYRKPHTATLHVEGAGLQAIGASRRGRAHAHDGRFREDDAAAEAIGDWLVAVVADGAGSARFSREGSRLACEQVVASLSESVPRLIPNDFDATAAAAVAGDDTANKQVRNLLYQTLCGAAFDAFKAIESRASSARHAVKDYATTLLIALCRRVEGRVFAGTFWIGDGAIAILVDGGRRTTLLGKPDGGEYSGQTRFLTMTELVSDAHEMLRRVEFAVEDDFCSLILASDGVSDARFGTDANLQSPPVWETLWKELVAETGLGDPAEAAAEQRLLEWLDFWCTGEHDDRTLVAVVPRESAS